MVSLKDLERYYQDEEYSDNMCSEKEMSMNVTVMELTPQVKNN